MAVIWLVFAARVEGQIQFSALAQVEYASGKTEESDFLENWTDLFLTRDRWRLCVRFSLHRPPAVFSQQGDSHGIAQRFIEYRHKGIEVRVGNFYGMLGRGIVLRAFENRPIRWDSNIDGVKVSIRRDRFSVQMVAGVPRKSRLESQELEQSSLPARGKRLPPLYGGEVTFAPWQSIQIGGTYLLTAADRFHRRGFHRGSLLGEINLPVVSFYGEYARLHYPGEYQLPDGQAIYFSSTLFIGSLTLLGEFKRYEHFAFQDGLLNNPPTAVREHAFTLMNRRQLIQNADNEQGFLVEASFPLGEDRLLTGSYSTTATLEGDFIYRDAYGQLEWSAFLNGEWLLGIGRQDEPGARFLNAVASLEYDLFRDYTLKMVLEHQHAKVYATERFTRRQYYDQLLTLGLSRPGWTLSFLGERSKDQFRLRDFWLGGQLDVSIAQHLDVTLFAGSRRKGKVCIGGVCVVKPELEGVEVTLIARL
ncbi:MAG: hypothetical protein D6681_02965 [Calditrichaeota bacterium]|nr:MAG: hypothetical protein D6681_02965 [Calditrichota bacterium]